MSKDTSLNSVQFAFKYTELKKQDPYKLLEKKQKEYEKKRTEYLKLEKEYQQMQNDFENNFKNYLKLIDTELKPLRVTVKDSLDYMQILD